jgi:hypothetical protein
MNAHDVGVIVAKNLSLLDENQRLKERIAWFENTFSGRRPTVCPSGLYPNLFRSLLIAQNPLQ